MRLSFRLLSLPLLFTVFSWAFNFVAIKLVYEQISAPALALVRFLIMYIIMIGICKAQGLSLAYPKGYAIKLLFSGFLSMGIYMILFLEGMHGSSASEGAIIVSTAPMFTIAFSVLAKHEPFKLTTFLGAGLAYLGVALVMLGGAHKGTGAVTANALILISAVIWAWAAVISKPLIHEVSATRFLTLSMPGGLAALIPYGLVPSLNVKWSALTPLTWLMMFHVVVLSGAIAFTCFYVGVQKIGPAGAVLYQFCVPPLTVLFAYLTLHQPMTALQILGFLVVLVGVIWASRSRLKSLEPKEELGDAIAETMA